LLLAAAQLAGELHGVFDESGGLKGASDPAEGFLARHAAHAEREGDIVYHGHVWKRA
jgi:hypothetical protein